MDSRAAEGATWWASVRKRPLLHPVQWGHLAAGLTGGVVATFVLHPLDLVKIRFKVNEGTGLAVRPQYNGMMDALRSIYRSNGIAGVYHGVVPNVLGTGISWGLFFFFYNDIKTRMQGGDAKKALQPMKAFIASCEADTVIYISHTTGTQFLYAFQSSHTVISSFLIYRCNYMIVSHSSFRSGWGNKGFLPGVFGVTHGAIQFMIYEEMKNKYSNTRTGTVDTGLSKFNVCLTFPAISKLIAVLITHPCQVVRIRLQDQHRSYSGVIDAMKQMIKFEGPRGLYKGVCVQLCQSIPNICIVFMVYECMTNRAMKVTAMDIDRSDI